MKLCKKKFHYKSVWCFGFKITKSKQYLISTINAFDNNTECAQFIFGVDNKTFFQFNSFIFHILSMKKPELNITISRKEFKNEFSNENLMHSQMLMARHPRHGFCVCGAWSAAHLYNCMNIPIFVTLKTLLSVKWRNQNTSLIIFLRINVRKLKAEN